MTTTNEIQPIQQTQPQGEIILYQPDETVRIEVRIGEETVWLTQQQMAELFDKDRTVISRHIRNIYKEEELDKSITCAKFAHMGSEGDQLYEYTAYNLDVIISVGYRVKSRRGTKFRQWANKILRDYLLRGYAFDTRFSALEQEVKRQGKQLKNVQEKIDFFVHTNLPPVEGVLFEGQIFDAYKLVEDLVKSAQQEIILIDNYIDASVFGLLEKRRPDVSAVIYTERVGQSLRHTQQLSLQQHGRQIELHEYDSRFHDRFLIVDDALYHFGASFKDLGRKLFAFERMGIDKAVIISQL